jgi:hypothetical protein
MYVPRFKQHRPVNGAQSMIDLSFLSIPLTQADDDVICLSCKYAGEIEDNGVSHGGYTEFCWQMCKNTAIELDHYPYGLLIWCSNGCRSFEHIEVPDCQLYEEKD